MKKANNKVRLLIVLVVIIVIGVGYFVYSRNTSQKQQVTENMSKWEDSYWNMANCNYRDDGVLYLRWDEYGGLISYCDNASGNDEVVCTDKTCKHSTAADSTCSARVSGNASGCAIRGEHLYYFDLDESDGEKYYLYQADLDGTHRQALCEVEDPDDSLHDSMVEIRDAYYTKQYVYYVFWEMDSKDDTRILRLGRIDLKTKKNKIVYRLDETDSMIHSIVVRDNLLVLAVSYNDADTKEVMKHKYDEQFAKEHDCSKIVGIDALSGKQQFILDGNSSNSNLSIVEGYLFYSKSQNEVEKSYYYDKNSQKEVEIDSHDLSMMQSDSNSKVYYMGYQQKDGENLYTYYQYDVKAGTMTKLGESKIFYDAVMGDHVYATISEGEEKGQLCFTTLEKLEASQADSYTIYKRD